jgi:hypothetical protein
MRNFIRTLLFIIFFSIGAGSLSISLLSVEILNYYRNKQLLTEAEETLDKLESLNTDYQKLLEQLDKDPNLIERIGPATLGTKPPTDANTVYPRVRAEELVAAKKALTMNRNTGKTPAVPDWLTRCTDPRRRILLFISGGFLILISFIFFGTSQKENKSKTVTSCQ